jgi:hypothetical protein
LSGGNIEETKINFFDPNRFKDDDSYYNMEKNEDDQILMGRIDPIEWKAEIDRVYSEMINIEKDMELIKMRGGGLGGDDEDIEQCRKHIELIVEMCYEIKQSTGFDTRKVFERSAQFLEEDLGFIRKNELRINKQNSESISKLGEL